MQVDRLSWCCVPKGFHQGIADRSTTTVLHSIPVGGLNLVLVEGCVERLIRRWIDGLIPLNDRIVLFVGFRLQEVR